MQLFYSPASPYVRMVLAMAHEVGLAERIELRPAKASPIQRNPAVVAKNPTGKVPTLLLDDGTALYDSRVICEYLDSRHRRRTRLYPAKGKKRWQVLALQALAHGLLDAALLARYEAQLRPEGLLWPEWLRGQLDKIDSSLDTIELQADRLKTSVHAGTIALACALGYLDFRFAERDWRQGRPKTAAWYARFAVRPSLQATAPKD